MDSLDDIEVVRRAKSPEPLAELALLDERREPRSCIEWQELRKEGYTPPNTVETQSDGSALYRCGTLAWLTRAKPAAVSYVHDLAWDEGLLKVLPPVLASTMADEELAEAAEAATKQGKSWAWFDPDAKAKPLQNVSGIEVVEGKSNGLTHLRATAWGDFTQDKLSDVVVLVTNADQLGPFVDFRLVLLTRRSAGTRLEIVETWSP